MKIRSLFLLILCFTILATARQAAFACSCLPTPTLDVLIDDSSTVMVIRVVSINKPNPTEFKPGDDNYNGTAVAVVEKSYKGSMKTGAEILLLNGTGADCRAIFGGDEIGDRFLVFTGNGEPAGSDPVNPLSILSFSVSFCGRYYNVENAPHMIEYLEKLARNSGRTRLSGYVTTALADTHDGIRVRVRSGKRVVASTVTKNDGFFEFFDLPAGTVDIVITPRSKSVIVRAISMPIENLNDISDRGPELKVEALIVKGRHLNLNLDFMPDNEVSGRVIGPDNRPIKEANVTIRPLNPASQSAYWRTTDDLGAFDFSGIAPGRYNIIVNEGNHVTAERPYFAHYYPGVTDSSKATEVTIAADTKLRRADIRVGEFIELMEIKGVARFYDLTPVSWADITVKAYLNDVELKFRNSTRDDGRFSLKIPANVPFELSADKFFGSPEICPGKQFASRFVDNTYKIGPLSSSELGDLSNIELVFPFSRCEENY